MLFNSYEFLFLFLPITIGVFFLFGRMRQQNVAITWLVLASLFFYAYWNPVYLILIVSSIIGNYWLGAWVTPARAFSWISRKWVLVAGISANLAALGYFKYANFFIDNINLLLETQITLEKVILPLAISFFTFQQIAFLVDSYRGETKEYSFLHYALFVTFFPQLIAGPIVHHKEMLPQFNNRAIFSPSMNQLALGITWLAVGLFKKVELADSLAEYSNLVFTAADKGFQLWLLEAWAGALAYTFQLFFDFSGYVDMAMGSAMMIGIRLPPNFNSPYKSLNIIEFWHRWHMTLSRFLRDYLYIAMGGNRYGMLSRYRNLALTMILGGLWHGASWTFVFWGSLHGLYLVVNHGWHAIRNRLGIAKRHYGKWGAVAAWLITFIAVVVGWVFFRAETFSGAINMLYAMFGRDWMNIPEMYSGRIGALEATLLQNGFTFNGRMVITLRDWVQGGILLAVSMFAALALPNTGELFGRLDEHPSVWQPTKRWAAFTCAILALSIVDLGKVSEFLYFNF